MEDTRLKMGGPPLPVPPAVPAPKPLDWKINAVPAPAYPPLQPLAFGPQVCVGPV